MRILLIVCVMLSSSFQAPTDFNTRLVAKLSEMTKTEMPKKLEIELVSQKKLQDQFKGEQMGDCLQETNGNFPYCIQLVESINVFIHGHWIPEKDPTHLHIVLWEKAGADVLVHEYLHWWLSYKTEPRGMVNTESIVDIMVRQVMTHPDFIEWLGGVK